MLTGRLRTAIVAAATVAVASIALADSVPAPPRSCARGSTPSPSGPYCEPMPTCTSNEDCEERTGLQGVACLPVALCVQRHVPTVGHPGLTYDAVVGVCGAHDACPAGAHCAHDNRCDRPPTRRPHGPRHPGS